eukprot:TRINITY_DN17658_c0_g1_i1.p1 TRINITY_DN17658_c0_g1~~TRINITY_DN17658_c0_g1_i1.p1  ORF type:complete len:723 (+),score=185.67 TRINITY_DN17658_c0_g1_i1:67-2235(+)
MGDHSYQVPKDIGGPELIPSEVQSWSSGGTAGILPAERKKATFDVAKMTSVIYGGDENVKKRKFVLAPGKRHEIGLAKHEMSREETMAKHFHHFIAIHKSFTKKGYRPSPEETAWMAACSMNSGALTTHMGLFLPTLVAQTTSAQQLQWLPRTMKFQIVGAYAQTELGHGSNVRGLQTTATYDIAAQQFVIETPTLQATKFWNSGVGTCATHCVLYAQLILKGKCYGVHVFFVQLRDENHYPLPGIEIGDCGKKLGDNAIDTGYIRFKDHRIPREHMLAKKSIVTAEGEYVKNTPPPSSGPSTAAAEKLSYMTMLTARSNMIGISGGKLALAVTTAVRYSCVRKQGFVNPSKDVTNYKAEEMQIIDYEYQNYRLMKQLATSLGIQFTSRWMMERFTQLSKGLWKVGFEEDDEPADAKNDANVDTGADLPEIHASSAGLKGLCCRLASDGMEDCRKCCGGHGYLLASGIAASWADYVWQATAEGDLVVMLLQTARFQLKSLDALRATGEAPPGILEYLTPLKNPSFTLSKTSFTPTLSSLEEVLKNRALQAVINADKRRETMAMVNAAERHCYYFMFLKFKKTVEDTTDTEVAKVLHQLCMLFGLSQIIDGSGWGGIIGSEGQQVAEVAVADILKALRPNAVSLVDSFDIPDRVLNSAIGRSDGNVYEALFKNARDSPLNTTGPFKGYSEFLKPHLDMNFLKLRGDAPKGLKNSMKARKKAKL